jgi:hypothetical protein
MLRRAFEYMFGAQKNKRSGLSRLHGRTQLLRIQECRRDLRVFVCRHVFAVCCHEVFDARFAGYVTLSHDEDSDEMHVVIACGLDDHLHSIADWKSVGLGHVLETNATLCDLPAMECGQMADYIDGLWRLQAGFVPE